MWKGACDIIQEKARPIVHFTLWYFKLSWITNTFIQYQKLWLVCWFYKHVCEHKQLESFVNTYLQDMAAMCQRFWFWPLNMKCSRKSKASTEKSSYTDFAGEQVGEMCRNCFDTVDIFTGNCISVLILECSELFGQQNFKWTLRSREEGGLWPNRPVEAVR